MPSYNSQRRKFLIAGSSFVALGSLTRWSLAQQESPAQADASATAGYDQRKYEQMVSKGIDYLISKGQADDGSFTRQIGIGVTALAATAMLRHGRSPEDPAVAKALKYIEQNVQPTGGIHAANGRLKTYETCVAVTCLAEANRDGRYDKILANADKFIREIPFDGAEGHDKDSFHYGGAGYGGQGRPDLSNTSFLIDALRSSGAKEDDPAIQQALIFVSRCQNLESPHNTTPFAAKINDGGYYYTPVPGKEEDTTGGLRSYGAMSYSGLKSMIFAGVTEDDPRVKAVKKWIGKNYDVTTNPGMGPSGVFYYYVTFAKALEAVGEPEVVDADGKEHNWRADLVNELAKRQREDGSWVNTSPQWMEGDANLCTAFALLALSHVPEAKQKTSQ